jgi:hypothetical protein
MTAAWFWDTCTTVKPWKVMVVSDTEDPDTTVLSDRLQQDLNTVPLTSTRPFVCAGPPIAEGEPWIASRFRKQLGNATMVYKTDLAWRNLLAHPVRGNLAHRKSRISQKTPCARPAFRCCPGSAPNSDLHQTHLVRNNLAISRLPVKPVHRLLVRRVHSTDHHKQRWKAKVCEVTTHTVRNSRLRS